MVAVYRAHCYHKEGTTPDTAGDSCHPAINKYMVRLWCGCLTCSPLVSGALTCCGWSQIIFGAIQVG